MATPETFRALLAANAIPQQRADLPQRTKTLCGKVNEFLYKLVHEPSLAGHRIQEHVHKTVPALVKEWQVLDSNARKLNGVMFDLDYTSSFLDKLDDAIRTSAETREIISELASTVSAASSRSSK